MATYILIEAESDIYSVTETIPESKAIKRLEVIKKSFTAMQNKFGSKSGLKVKTGIHNPKLFS